MSDTSSTKEQTKEANRRRWREALERLGVDTVRTKLRDNAGTGPGADVKYIVTEGPPPTRAFIEEWLAEKDAADRKRRAKIDLWTLIFAAVGAATGIIGIGVALLHR